MKKTVGICVNDGIFSHSGNWNKEWLRICEENKIPYRKIDCYKWDILEKKEDYVGVLWAIQNYVLADMIEARNILYAMNQKNIKIFPDYNTCWHFDDKIAEMYMLQSISAPIPKSWVFYNYNDCINWLQKYKKYPLVAKLKSGSGSNNVKLLRNYNEAKKYAEKMFGSGLNPSPSFMYKAYSKAQSSKDLKDIINRIKKVPEFLSTLSHAKQFPNEKGYCYFQEYIHNDGYDIKIVVIGDKLSFIVRGKRKGDWRASGGGDCFYERKLVTKEIINTAFRLSDEGRFQCMGYDFLVNKRTGQGIVIEMSYGFDYKALLEAGGYWDRNGKWHEEPINAPKEILYKYFLGE